VEEDIYIREDAFHKDVGLFSLCAERPSLTLGGGRYSASAAKTEN
jgi:hypothetical protein